ncbi:hypothetical protein [Coralliovum pocilloporae]|uniref:hypothetical protein n=1 Tax=Coralliovum pocilloporae TaxID=3066369 RepID=UPI003306B7B7
MSDTSTRSQAGFQGFTVPARLPDYLMDSLLAGLVLALLGPLFYLTASEVGGTNSYAALAASFLDGRLDVDRCFDVDCATGPDGRNWVIFPPFPALVTMPFVALFGAGFSGFHLIALAAVFLASLLWRRIFLSLGLNRRGSLWLTAALIFGSPVLFVVLRADMVWFYAQSIAFLLVTAALYEALHRKRLLLIGLYIGLAFLTRQMSVFYAPLMLVMVMDPGRTVFRIDREVLWKTLLIGLPIAAAILAYFGYNWVRFGSVTETGYRYLIDPNLGLVEGDIIASRLNTIGLFSTDYVLFNTVYLFLQGFHLDFTGPVALTPVGMDRFGTSLLAGSPFVLLALLAPVRREMVVGWLVIALITGITLFYHSNGYTQVNVQRYTLDWLPILFLFLGWALRAPEAKATANGQTLQADTGGRFDVARLLILYSLTLNLAAIGFTALFG